MQIHYVINVTGASLLDAADSVHRRPKIESRRGINVRLDERNALDILIVDGDFLAALSGHGLAYLNARG